MIRSVRHPITLSWLGHGISASFAGYELRNDLATWLSPPDPFTNYNTASQARYDGTGVWFTESAEFKSWKESISLLWVYGKRTFTFCGILHTRSYQGICMFSAGAGKSVITYVILLFISVG